MEEKTTMRKLELVHQPNTYKITIPKEVERKIRILCREIHNVEWSGILFYRVEGNFEDNSLNIICVDIFQMDEGSSGYTEFNMSPDVMGYMVDHPELLEEGIYQGLIHSHNNMATFFSGTDTATLQSEGSDTNHFVSLIVNNAGKYTAGITRKAKVKQVVKEEYSYPTWNNNNMSNTREFTVEKEYIQWFNLVINIEGKVDNFESEMLERIKEIRKNKVGRHSNLPFSSNPNYPSRMNSNANTIQSSRVVPVVSANKAPKQASLFEKEEPEVNYEEIKIDKDIVDWVVKQTITCSIIIPNHSNIDINKWVDSMDRLYSKRFGSVKEFEHFASGLVDYIIHYTKDEDALEVADEDEVSAALAFNVIEALKELPSNEWLDKWIEMYEDYIIL